MNKYYMWLSTAMGGANPKTYELLAHFGTPEAVWAADYEEYVPFKLSKWDESRLLVKNMDEINSVLRFCEENEIGIITLGDCRYPERLNEISDPPLVLYYRGDLSCLEDTLAIAIVGTRGASSYGIAASEKIAGGLAKTGFLIVSGMADGIDSAASIGAIKAGGKTAVVFGNGVDKAFPTRNEFLMRKIIEDSGVVISEYPPKTPGLKHHFPARNRIISGLSNGVLVVEAPERSGALITARYALEQNRDLYVVPGNITSEQSRGTLKLLKENCAKPVSEALDIIREYIDVYPHKIKHVEEAPKRTPKVYSIEESLPRKIAGSRAVYDSKSSKDDDRKAELELAPLEREILGLLNKGEHTADELVPKTGQQINKISVALTMLEAKGYVKAIAGGRYTSAF